jgi:hypothetical protein
MTDRKKPGVAFWATVVVVTVLLYVLSVGPACWVSSRANSGASTVSLVYRPLTWGMSRSERIADAVDWYSQLGSADGWAWIESNAGGSETCHWMVRPSSPMGMY